MHPYIGLKANVRLNKRSFVNNNFLPATFKNVYPSDKHPHRWKIVWDNGHQGVFTMEDIDIEPDVVSCDEIPAMGDMAIGRYIDLLKSLCREQAATIAMLSQQLSDKKEIIRRLTA